MEMVVNPGEMNKKIVIVDREEKPVHKTWASVRGKSIKEVTDAGEEINEIRKRFLIRWTPKKITRDMFVRYKGVYYQIIYANNYNEENYYIEILAEAGKR